MHPGPCHSENRPVYARPRSAPHWKQPSSCAARSLTNPVHRAVPSTWSPTGSGVASASRWLCTSACQARPYTHGIGAA